VPICQICWEEIPIASGGACQRCGDSIFDGAVNSSLCRRCRAVPPPFVRAVAYGPYEDAMREAIHALKYGRLHGAARGLGRLLAEAIAQLAPDAPAEMLVVPVPLHRSKHAERGFNQARSLAIYAVERLRHTHPEWRLKMASTTLMRLRGAFEVSDAAAVRGTNLLLIDDIFTTGSTARAAAQAIMRAGAESVWVATLARAGRVREGRNDWTPKVDEAEKITVRNGDEPAANLQGAKRDSLHGQSSF
jgi:ComF family protein